MTRQPLCRSTPSDRLYMLRGCSCALQRKPHLQRDGYTHTHTHTILNQHSQDRYRKRSWASRRVEATDSTLQHHRRRQQHTAHLVSPDYSKIKWGASIREAPEIEATQSTSVLLRDKGWDANPRPPPPFQHKTTLRLRLTSDVNACSGGSVSGACRVRGTTGWRIRAPSLQLLYIGRLINARIII